MIVINKHFTNYFAYLCRDKNVFFDNDVNT